MGLARAVLISAVALAIIAGASGGLVSGSPDAPPPPPAPSTRAALVEGHTALAVIDLAVAADERPIAGTGPP